MTQGPAASVPSASAAPVSAGSTSAAPPPVSSASAAERRVRSVRSSPRSFLARRSVWLVVALVLWPVVYLNLDAVAHWLTTGVLGLDETSRLGSAVEFFLYDAPKVLLLLVLVVFAVGIVRSYFTAERTRALLAGRGHVAGNVAAAGLGIVTPFCSCSAVPLFIGFVTVGVPLGVTLSFLIAAPMVNEVALVLLWGLFGWQVALLYLVTGLVIAIVSGLVLGRLRLERFVEPWVYDLEVGAAPAVDSAAIDRVGAGITAVKDVVGRVWPYLLAGIAVGALIHGYVPEQFLASVMGEGAWWSVPLAVVLGVPMYANAAGMIPVVEALLDKGAALGTALAFMMAVIALSFPEFVILRKVLRPQLLAVFAGIVALGITVVGLLFNLVDVGAWLNNA